MCDYSEHVYVHLTRILPLLNGLLAVVCMTLSQGICCTRSGNTHSPAMCWRWALVWIFCNNNNMPCFPATKLIIVSAAMSVLSHMGPMHGFPVVRLHTMVTYHPTSYDWHCLLYTRWLCHTLMHMLPVVVVLCSVVLCWMFPRASYRR